MFQAPLGVTTAQRVRGRGKLLNLPSETAESRTRSTRERLDSLDS